MSSVKKKLTKLIIVSALATIIGEVFAIKVSGEVFNILALLIRIVAGFIAFPFGFLVRFLIDLIPGKPMSSDAPFANKLIDKLFYVLLPLVIAIWFVVSIPHAFIKIEYIR